MKPNLLRRFLLCAALMIIALAAYWPVTQAQFVSWDDGTTVFKNPALTNPSWKLFRQRWTGAYSAMYMPVTQTFYQAAAFAARTPSGPGTYDIHPTAFHWGMVLLALANIPLLFTLLVQLVGDDFAAAAGAGVMALHPMTDEAVAWISEVSIPLCATCLLIALIGWVSYRRGAKRKWIVLAFVFYLLALLAKPLCICIPIMAWSLDVWFFKIDWKKSAMMLVPWLLPGIALGLYQGHLQSVKHYPVFVPAVWQRPAVAIDSLAFYLGKIMAPVHLGIDYGRTPNWTLHQHSLLIVEAIALALLAAGIWLARKQKPLLICAAIFFITSLGAVLGLTPFWFQVFSSVANRYAYVPLIGIALAVATLLAGVRLVLPWILVVAALITGACLTHHQDQIWHDSDSLYAHAVQVHPHSWMGWDNIAFMLVGRHHTARGLLLSRVAYALDSTQTDIYSNTGTALAVLGKPKQAIPYFRYVIYSKPEDPITSMDLGAAYVQLHQYDLGIKWLRYALQYDPKSDKGKWLLKGALELRNGHATTQPGHTHP